MLFVLHKHQVLRHCVADACDPIHFNRTIANKLCVEGFRDHLERTLHSAFSIRSA